MAEYTLNMTGEQIDAALVKANQSLSQSEVETLLTNYPTETEVQTLLSDYPTETEVQTLLNDYEPVHSVQTVTGTNGSLTIGNHLEGPILDLTAQGFGAPGIFYYPGMSAQEQGQQTWNTPLCLDVPIGIIGEEYPVVLNYGGGIGNNTFTPTAGKETGTTIYYNSRELIDLFQAAEDADANAVNEPGSPSTTRFEVPLPFSVADNSVVYSSHLKNQNVAGEEGIWASGNKLYIRMLSSRVDNRWSSLISIMQPFATNVNYYDPWNPKGMDPVNWLDFFVCVTASANYTKIGKVSTVELSSGTYSLSYIKISDHVAIVSGQGEANPTPVPSISATYYANTDINKYQQNAILGAITEKFNKTIALGSGAYTLDGGAVGRNTYSLTGGAVGNEATATIGFAGGDSASATEGGAVGSSASATTGGAVGLRAKAANGGAVGLNAEATYGGGAVGAGAKVSYGGAVGGSASANSGGAVGRGATTGDGAAIGYNAKCKSGYAAIDAIQLGTGTNATAQSMQVYDTVLLTPTTLDGQSIRVIPLSLITASYRAASAEDQAAFKNALGFATVEDIAAAFNLSVQ